MGLMKKKIEGYPMWLNPGDHGISKALLKSGRRERAFMYLLRTEASGGVAFDIGANIGYTTISLANQCDKVYAFEPDKRSFKMLKLNALPNVECYKLAIADYCGKLNFYATDKPNLSTTCKGQGGKKKTVDCATIDTFMKFHYNPVFMKMDLEGGEVAAIRGAMKAIASSSKVKLLIELHPQYYSKENDFAGTLETLLELGYDFKYIINAKGHADTVKAGGALIHKSFKEYSRSIYTCNEVDRDTLIGWSTEMWNAKGSTKLTKVLRAILLSKDGRE